MTSHWVSGNSLGVDIGYFVRFQLALSRMDYGPPGTVPYALLLGQTVPVEVSESLRVCEAGCQKDQD